MLYYRRKIVLALIQVFGGSLTAKSLQKYLFLLTREQTKKSFDFIPYKYGCFSFQANQDLSTMAKYGYISIEESEYGRFIKLNNSDSFIELLETEDKRALLDIKECFGHFSQKELIGYTYRHYPYYAINSSIADVLLSKEELVVVAKQKRKFTEPGLFSIGYEGISLESYINKLIINDVHVLCDVRKNAFSQKYGFSKSQLKTACEGVGIRYLHIPQLGIDSDLRQELKTQADYDRLFDQYETTTLKNNLEALLYLKSIFESEKRVAVTCFEKDPAQCHRSRVAKALLQLPNIDCELKIL
ncbi:MAG: DUF488 family protein [Bacteroidia bacterium]|nr:DUF488 family protein [Bacteroidia bacterium]